MLMPLKIRYVPAKTAYSNGLSLADADPHILLHRRQRLLSDKQSLLFKVKDVRSYPDKR